MPKEHTRFITQVVLACALFASCADDEADTHFPSDTVQQLDQAIAAQVQAENLPGVVVLVSIPGVGEYRAARGRAQRSFPYRQHHQNLYRYGYFAAP
jgi:dienelactone hydrolase